MKNIRPIRHGEVILKEVEYIPEGAQLKEEVFSTIVAHSETGHHHILEVKDKIDGSKIKVFSWNGEKYLEVPQFSSLWHQKTGKDIHTPHEVQPALYKITIKKEFDYFQRVLREVRD